ncbi:A/G-specific adenine glycosylase [Candidatus Beckwithbacteria bacterium]|nr:A/G-specific adenine glycosylase [Candidatus Beckwithbacteria bacterium]
MKTLKTKNIKLFQSFIWNFYAHFGRDFPWRQTTNPYHILVSEIMLQQTQANRVIPKYEAFIKNFPTLEKLANAEFKTLLYYWQGLGYNRRALYLQQLAQAIIKKYHGQVPSTQKTLVSLPGIGRYTAAAIQAFAFNQASMVIETNIRTVFIYHFFPKQKQVSDQEIITLINQTVDKKNPREWYWALMDYGAIMKSLIGNSSQQSKHYTKQSKFVGSNRQIRGQIVRLLIANPMVLEEILQKIKKPKGQITPILDKLVAEKMITIRKGKYQIVTRLE